MTFCDIEYIIDSMNSSFTVTKIFIIRNWLQMNERLVTNEQVKDILNKINDSACYIPKRKIQFMRDIRDIILKNFM